MHLVVEVLWGIDHKSKFHMLAEVDTVEVVVPSATVLRHHKVAQEFVREDDLNTLVVLRAVALRICGRVLVALSPV